LRRAGWANDGNLAGRAVESDIRTVRAEHKVRPPKVNLSRCNNACKALILRVGGQVQRRERGLSPPASFPIVLQRHAPHYAAA
jgi:hypothetical protein